MAHLFDELTVRSLTLRNRIGVSPMCQYSSDEGMATDWHMVHLGSRAVGGAALVIAEATAVEARGRISPQDAGLWCDAQIDPLRRINRFIASHGAVAGVQLAHAGRKGSVQRPWDGGRSLLDPDGGWETVSPSALAFDPERVNRVPHALTTDEIVTIQESFVQATHRALAAEYQWLELHAAHGYLCHSFQSPLSNQRTDAYGGSFENRIRFTLETARRMRAIWPDHLPFTVRLSCTDWASGGWTLEDTVELSKRLAPLGVDLIDCTSGGGTPDAQIPMGPGYQVPLSEKVRSAAHIPTAAVGYITSPFHADEIIRNGRADVVLLAREMLRDPYWPVRAAQTLKQMNRLKTPIQYRAMLTNM